MKRLLIFSGPLFLDAQSEPIRIARVTCDVSTVRLVDITCAESNERIIGAAIGLVYSSVEWKLSSLVLIKVSRYGISPLMSDRSIVNRMESCLNSQRLTQLRKEIQLTASSHFAPHIKMGIRGQPKLLSSVIIWIADKLNKVSRQ